VQALQEALKNFGLVRLALAAAILLGVASGFYYLLNHLSKPEMALLYGNLEMADAAKIVQRMESLNVPVELRGGGTQIFVPADKVARMRLEMAELGLPKSGTIGYEIFDREETFGASSFVQGINHLRALEGEIARTISSLSQVSSARVHLVLPKRRLFSRESEEPSAAIMLSLAGPGRLPAAKVSAIQQLVAAAVPGLSPERVSIVDDRGNLLARVDSEPGSMTAVNLDERKIAYENRLSQALENLIARYVGDGKVRVEVAADMDYDRFTENAEIFDPDGQVIRSTQTIHTGEEEEGQNNLSVSAASNQPNAKVPDTGGKTSSKSNRKEEIKNYEISKRIKTHIRESGAIKRLSVAVMVDGIYSHEKGKEGTYQPRPEAEMQQLTKLVQTAIGFNKERGDVVEVINMRFAPMTVTEVASKDEPFWGLSRQDIIRIVEVLIIGVLAFLTLFLVIKPLTRQILAGVPALTGPSAQSTASENLLAPVAPMAALPSAHQTSDHMAEQDFNEGAASAIPSDPKSAALEEMVSIKKVEGQIRASSLKTVSDIVENNIDEAVAVIRNWITKTG
jgi:flagellar M-ring protein FliF